MQSQAYSEGDAIVPYFLAQGEQRADDVAQRLAQFIHGAERTLDLAVYDLRLSPPLRAPLVEALAERARAGVAIRIAYDADKPPDPLMAGGDPSASGTGAFVQSLGYPWRRIGGEKLMHNKYLVRDAGTPLGRVWTGSTNLTDDSWTLQENTILDIASPELAGAYARDFQQLWDAGVIENTGAFANAPVNVEYGGAVARIEVYFAPGRGPDINREVARRLDAAGERVRICSMLLNSGAMLNALLQLVRLNSVEVSGVYDQTQMADVLRQWQTTPHNVWKIDAVREIVERAGLVGKRSMPYAPGNPHDFMHNKTLVIDNTVITGSYNFSYSAEQNAENILFIESAPLADAYARYIDHLARKYGG